MLIANWPLANLGAWKAHILEILHICMDRNCDKLLQIYELCNFLNEKFVTCKNLGIIFFVKARLNKFISMS